jgi:hypothetical protein
MSKLLIAVAIGTFALGVFVGYAVGTAPNASATTKTSNVDQVVPFDLMSKSKGLPVESASAF